MASRTELVNALDMLSGAVAQKALVPILTHVLVEPESMLAHNQIIGIKVRVATGATAPFNVKGEFITNLLKRLDSEEVTFRVMEDGKVEVRCGGHRSLLAQMGDPFPRPKLEARREDWVDVAAGFSEAIERALPCASADEGRAALCGVYLEAGEALAADGVFAVRCQLGTPFPSGEGVLLPRRAAEEIVRLGNPKRAVVSSGALALDYHNVLFIARLLDLKTQFPADALRKMLDERCAGYGRAAPVPDGLQAALSRLALVADRELGCTLASAAPTRAAISIGNSLMRVEEALDFGTTPPPLPREEVTFHPDRLLTGLRYGDRVAFGPDPGDPIYVEGDLNSYQFMMMPMQPGAVQPPPPPKPEPKDEDRPRWGAADTKDEVPF